MTRTMTRTPWLARIRFMAGILAAILSVMPGMVTPSHGQTAWDQLSSQDASSDTVEDYSDFERRILQAMSPEQAVAYAEGADPRDLVLASGETLAELMARILGEGTGTTGLVYHPLPTCILVRTVTSTAGALQPDVVRDFIARGETTDLSAQGGSATGCGVPDSAEALIANFIVVAPSDDGELKVWRSDLSPGASSLIRFTSSTAGIQFDNAAPIALCTDAGCPSEFRVQSRFAITHLRVDVMGYFTPGAGGNTLAAADGEPAAAVYVDEIGQVGIGTTVPSQKLDVAGALRLGSTAQTGTGSLRWTGADFEGYTGSGWTSLTAADWADITGKPSTFPPSDFRAGNFTVNGTLDVRDDTEIDGDLRIDVNSTNSPRLFLGSSGLVTMEAFYRDSARIEVKGYDTGDNAARVGIDLTADDRGGEITLLDGNPTAVPNTINQTVFLDGRSGSRGGRVTVRDGLRSDPLIELIGEDTSDGLDIAMIRVTGGIAVAKDGGVGGFVTADQVILSDYLQLDLTSGSPPSSDCNSQSEWGRMKVDGSAGVLYVCVSSGWVAK